MSTNKYVQQTNHTADLVLESPGLNFSSATKRPDSDLTLSVQTNFGILPAANNHAIPKRNQNKGQFAGQFTFNFY